MGASAGDATVINSGTIYAGGNNPFIAVGIYAGASGFGNTATVDNTGDIYVAGAAFYSAGIQGYSSHRSPRARDCLLRVRGRSSRARVWCRRRRAIGEEKP